MTDNHPDQVLDARGLLCPLPVLKARKRLEGMASGEVLEVVATDPMAAIDMPHFCTEQGHVLVESRTVDADLRFWIKRR
jgi:tRNA 2-thiouridine synthesizing protein A